MNVIPRYLVFIAVSIIVCNGCSSKLSATGGKTQKEFYKDYFLVKCIHLAFGNDPIFEKDVSLPIFNEWTDYVVSTSHGRKIDSLVSLTVKSIKVTPVEDYGDAKPIFANLLDYYNSKKFDSEIKKILKSPKTER